MIYSFTSFLKIKFTLKKRTDFSNKNIENEQKQAFPSLINKQTKKEGKKYTLVSRFKITCAEKFTQYFDNSQQINKIIMNQDNYIFNHTQRQSNQSRTITYVTDHLPLNLTPNQQAAKNLSFILQQIIKRKLLKSLEQIKMNNFDRARKQIVSRNIQLGYRLEKTDKLIQRTSKTRTRSMDPYLEHSRSQLLHDIIVKLKAKNQGHNWQQENTTVLYEKVRNNLYNTNSMFDEYQQRSFNEEEIKEAIRNIGKDLQQKGQNKKFLQKDSVLQYEKSSAQRCPKNYHQQYASQQMNYRVQTKRNNNFSIVPSNKDYQRVRFLVSPEPIHKTYGQIRPNKNFHNEYQSNPSQNRAPTQSAYLGTSFINGSQQNAHFIDINASNSFENMLMTHNLEPSMKNFGQSTILGRERSNSKQKIKIISELPFQKKKKQDVVRRNYQVITPSVQSHSHRLVSPIKIGTPQSYSGQYHCDYCDRCCSCAPQP